MENEIMEKAPDGLPGYHETPIRVAFGHVDNYGYLWHGHALSFFEMARADVVRPFGLAASELLKSDLAVPMLNLSVEYKNPAYDDEELVVQSTLARLTIPLPYLDFYYRIVRKQKDGGATEILRGKTRQIVVRKSGEVIIRIPQEMQNKLDRLREHLDSCPGWPD